MTVIIRAELRTTSEQRGEFLRVAVELAAVADSQTGTVQYRWFSSADPTAFVVIEEYVDAAAALAHNERCSGLLGQMARLAEMTRVDLHGALGADLQEWVDAHPQARGFVPLGAEGPQGAPGR